MLEPRETDLDFYSRRAIEAAQAAAIANSPAVGTAHRHMAAAYAARLREEEDAAAGFEALLSSLDDPEEDEPLG